MINAFTGETMDRQTPTSRFEELRAAALKRKAIDDAEMIPYGERGEFRPKSMGVNYGIPPTDGTYCEDKVDQTGADAVDINKIMERVDPSGKQFAKAVAQGFQTPAGMFYDDFTSAPDFAAAQEIFVHGKAQFEMLPAKLRSRFNNDPQEFMDYIHNPANLEEQYTLGIRVKPPVKEPEVTLKDINETLKTQKSSVSKAKNDAQTTP